MGIMISPYKKCSFSNLNMMLLFASFVVVGSVYCRESVYCGDMACRVSE